MSETRKNDGHGDKPPETALEEVVQEIEDAETRSDDSPEERRHRGEAAEAITPSPHAQEESRDQ